MGSLRGGCVVGGRPSPQAPVGFLRGAGLRWAGDRGAGVLTGKPHGLDVQLDPKTRG